MDKRKKIGKKGEEILSAISDYLDRCGFPPTVRELCELVDLKSTSSVQRHLVDLEEKGYITRNVSNPRAIKLTDRSSHTPVRVVQKIPVMKSLSDDIPVVGKEDIVEYLVVVEPGSEDKMFAVKIENEDLLFEGLLKGDYLICKHSSNLTNNDIGLAYIDNELVLCRCEVTEGRDEFVALGENSPAMSIEKDNIVAVTCMVVRSI